MKKKLISVILYFTCILMLILFTLSCKKRESVNKKGPCPGITPGIVPSSPYQDPVWHPSGNIIGFNHVPIKEIHYPYGDECPGFASYTYKTDSAGFWLINADGSNMHRILPYTLQTPAWSPDGNWIAFVKGAQLFKMPFDGEQLDTTAAVQLTQDGRNSFPAWSADGNWITYHRSYASPEISNIQGIWLISKDGNNMQQLYSGNSGYPCWNSSNNISFLRGVVNSTGSVLGDSLLSYSLITKDISNLLFFTGDNRYSKYSPDGSQLAFISQNNTLASTAGIHLFIINSDGSNLKQLAAEPIEKFSWSPDGRLVYELFNYNGIDQTQGTLWIMDRDGTHKKQLTYNQFKIIH